MSGDLRGQEECYQSLGNHPHPTLSSAKCREKKKQKQSSKRSRASEEPTHSYDHHIFFNESTAEKFSLISKNRPFIKEKGFHHPDDFFHKTIANKGRRALFQPLNPVSSSVVRDFYANLAPHILKKVWVHELLVDFSAMSINRYYNLEPANPESYDRLKENPNYSKVLRMLTNRQGEWKLNSEGFYANLASHILEMIRVREVLVDFSATPINRYYNLESANPEAYDRLQENPNYPEVLRMLTNGQGEWKLKCEGNAVHFKAKQLTYIP